MKDQPIAPPQPPLAAPLFLLSFRHRDELAGAVSRAGWHAIAARRAEGVERRFIASGASVAVVDARGALGEGLDAVKLLADAVQANASALVALLSRKDVAALDAFHAAGATHYLASPFGENELAQALRFAERHSERLAGGWRGGLSRSEVQRDEGLTWHYDMTTRAVRLSAALRARLALGEGQARLGALYRMLDRDGRAAARGAARRLAAGTNPTAFTHALRGGNRVAQHLNFNRARGTVIGTIETLRDDMDDAGPRNPDPLTGLGDGVEARQWLSRRLQAGQGTVVLLLSITRFEMVNTAYGRATGDALLQATARRIERIVSDVGGKRPLLARMAGAEFLIGLPAPLTVERAQLLADQLIAAVRRPFMANVEMIALGCRIGIVQAGADDQDVTALLRRASAALADAKSSEGAPVRLLSSADEDYASWRSRLEVDLRLALAQDEIEILFQPQVSVVSGEIVGVEALARWRHPDFGELGAATLFAAAERSDYLAELSDHVQRRAIAAAAAWPPALDGLRLAVNVIASDVARPSFADQFLAMADACGFARARLTVEVTESGLIEDLKLAADLLAALRAGGCRVAIDDFGTGYSSLAYLKALPLDYLKIDKRLSQDIAGSARDRVVVRGVIEMARSLGLSVIAEGVETAEQLALLAQEGCNFYQGFLCAEPLTTAELAALVTRLG
nr:bifunctional diguanylate cyclase/phosphodiesterase [Sphingomonas sp. SCN 67-18]